MSTFLELCRDVATESGTVADSSQIVSVASAPGRLGKIVHFTRQAWVNIQNARTDWLFMRHTLLTAIVPDVAVYRPADFQIENFGRWMPTTPDYRPFSIFDPVIGVKDETPLSEIPFTLWRERYGRGEGQRQRPHEYAIAPSGELCFGDMPDKTYSLRGDYVRGVQRLALDAEQPILPDSHHDVIKYRARALLGAHDEAPFEVGSATAEYRIAYTRLVNEQTGTEPLSIYTGGTDIR